ncbi:hypothetical protein BC343_17980 [Mucilaginibacter pedocola]|uniref:Uncharacterized protein n=1 Tax=Mucilaginibacter pedocola TaxID=1792845 RepID=A0A1S9P7F9_9SPHI|nr:hypothetical protein BC343_17980 [Mucilaginibacter pedocola]
MYLVIEIFLKSRQWKYPLPNVCVRDTKVRKFTVFGSEKCKCGKGWGRVGWRKLEGLEKLERLESWIRTEFRKYKRQTPVFAGSL